MSPVQLLEPTYTAIKRRLVEGVWPAGYKLATSHLAAELDVSPSPVRDSLNHLAGEELVDFVAGAGFFVPAPDARTLIDMLAFNLLLLTNALFDTGGTPFPPSSEPLPLNPDITGLFRHLAGRAGNDELVAAVDRLGERLNPYRKLDAALLGGTDVEIAMLASAITTAAPAMDVAEILARYHARRISSAPDYVRLRADPTIR